ncbi:MAG: hypothetical protein RSE97_07720, partial [Oscillospiraceae bacterium]
CHGAKRQFALDLSLDLGFFLFGISKNRFSFRKKRNGVLRQPVRTLADVSNMLRLIGTSSSSSAGKDSSLRSE